LTKKPKWDIYTSLLFISLCAIITGIVFLCLELQRYDWIYQQEKLPSTAASSLELPPTNLV